MKSIHITSLGCPKNLVDTEVMIGILEKGDWQVVSDADKASVLLINTCGFVQPAVEEGIEEILGMATVKKEFPEKKLVVTGCMVQRYKQKLQDELPEIDLLVGTEGVPDICRLLDQLLLGKLSMEMYLPSAFLMEAKHPRKLVTPFFRSWMKITEGCDNYCSYCMIPSIRGKLRSRAIEDLLVEATAFESKGGKELTLIAQDLTAYGRDRGDGTTLPSLLQSILKTTEIPWIRMLYLYPSTIEQDLLLLMRDEPRIVPYLDIPFQHVSDRVLAGMNRRYTGSDLVALIERLRDVVPDIAIRTTLLLGFPGETDRDITLVGDFLQAMQVDHVGVFGYANEEGASSENYPDQVPEEVIRRRVDHVLALQAGISSAIQQKYVGRIEPVLVEGLSRETDLLLEGRTRFQAPDIDGCVYINDGMANPGDIVNVRINDSQVYDLVGAVADDF